MTAMNSDVIRQVYCTSIGSMVLPGCHLWQRHQPSYCVELDAVLALCVWPHQPHQRWPTHHTSQVFSITQQVDEQ